MAPKTTAGERSAAATLSARERVIATLLRQASKPLSAYDLIKLLRDQGMSGGHARPATPLQQGSVLVVVALLGEALRAVNVSLEQVSDGGIREVADTLRCTRFWLT